MCKLNDGVDDDDEDSDDEDDGEILQVQPVNLGNRDHQDPHQSPSVSSILTFSTGTPYKQCFWIIFLVTLRSCLWSFFEPTPVNVFNTTQHHALAHERFTVYLG